MTSVVICVRIALLLSLIWEPSFCWRWKTNDALIQDVWPDGELVKMKRASASNTPIPRKPLHQKSYATPPDDDDFLVFEGHYYKPNDNGVPPPPAFMVEHSNWKGTHPMKFTHDHHETINQIPVYVTSVGPSGRPDSASQKFTAENSKGYNKVSTASAAPVKNSANGDEEEDASKGELEENSSSASKNVDISSSPTLFLEDLQFVVEQAESQSVEDYFKDAPSCFTATDTPGRCVHFRQCFPVVFNVINGELRNPGLAKLLYQASGPCNATLELDFILNKSTDDKKFLDAEFYNQTICCPGFKHPPALYKSWTKDTRNTRLTNEEKSSVEATTLDPADPSTEEAVTNRSNGDSRLLPPGRRPLAIEDSSVEVDSEDADSDEDEEEEEEHEAIEADEILATMEEVLVKENTTTSWSNSPGEERRGDRDKENKVEVADTSKTDAKNHFHAKKPEAFFPVAAPNLAHAPAGKCQNQIYGMPRGHWPWMVALLISSRHICSGALIDEKHVLTAAHCVEQLDEKDVRKIRIIIGDRVMYSAADGPHFWRKVTKIITHLNYNQRTFASDIAILRMNSAVPFSRNIQPISLSEPISIDTFFTDQTKAIVAGWSGADIGQPTFEARTEVETVVDFMDKTECRNAYRGFSLTVLPTNTFCIKAANNTCVADSGAPLFVRVQNCWRLMGIMSWGLGCSHFPEIYTDVSRYVPWIRKHIAP